MGKFTDEELEGLSDEELEAINESEDDDDADFETGTDIEEDQDSGENVEPDDDTSLVDNSAEIEKATVQDASKEAEAVKPADNDARDSLNIADHQPVVVNPHDTKIAELEKSFNDGDLDFDAYIKERLSIERDKTREIVRDETLKMSAENTWKSEQDTFFSTNDHLKSNPIVYDAFAREVNKLLADKAWASKPGDILLAEAKKAIEKAFNVEVGKGKDKDKSKGQEAVKDAKKASASRATPRTLKDVPASDGNMDGGFEYLDKLDGVAYELAVSKLSTAELEAYARA